MTRNRRNRHKRLTEPPDTAAAGLFEPEEAPVGEAPVAAEPEAVTPSAPARVRFPTSHHLSYENGCFHVLTEPDHPRPRLVLANVIDCLHPDQLPRLAAMLRGLLQESRPQVSDQRHREDEFQAPYKFNPNATAEDIPL
ncbi:hypothetical protein BH11PLA2_BH11PLA2_32640 [soil metagenome]